MADPQKYISEDAFPNIPNAIPNCPPPAYPSQQSPMFYPPQQQFQQFQVQQFQPQFQPHVQFQQPQMMPMMNTVTVMPQAMMMQSQQSQFGKDPQKLECPHCKAEIKTSVKLNNSSMTHIAALMLCCVGCVCCAWIPYVMESCKDAEHTCPSCERHIGHYRQNCTGSPTYRYHHHRRGHFAGPMSYPGGPMY